MTAPTSSPFRVRIAAILLSKNFMRGCFLVYMALRVAILFITPFHQASDSLYYYQSAIGIAEGHGYEDKGVLTAFWPVGWPGLLGVLFWLFGPYGSVGKIANLVFAAMTFMLAVAVAERCFSNRLVAPLTALLLTVYPNQIAYIPSLVAETYYEFLLLLAVWLLSKERIGWALLAGIAFGIASLTKAQTPPIPIVLLVGTWLLARRRPSVTALSARLVAVVIAMVLVIAPWTFRNYQVFGAFVPISTNGGRTLLYGNNPSAKGNNSPNDPLAESISWDPREQIAIDRLARAEALHWIESHPVEFLKVLPRKVWYLWATDGEGEWLFEMGYPEFLAHEAAFNNIRIADQLYYLVLLTLAAASLIPLTQQLSRMSPWAVSGWILVAYFTAISLVFSGQPRFHFPVMPWIAMYSALSLAGWLSKGAACRTSGSTIGFSRTSHAAWPIEGMNP